MMKTIPIILAIALAAGSSAHALTTTEWYEIQEGSYVVEGGFIGTVTTSLPDARQRYVELMFDHDAGTARMRIVGENGLRIFRRFENGVLEGGMVRFSEVVKHPSYPLIQGDARLDFLVQLGDATIWIDGTITALAPICCDIPHTFRHVGVRATIFDGPPRDPVGIYDFRGYYVGVLSVTGVVAITSGGDMVEGTWRLGALSGFEEFWMPNPSGELVGSLGGTGLWLNLNPNVVDDNVYLSGRLVSDRRYEGDWSYATFLGEIAGGTFAAEKKSFRVELRSVGTNEFVLEGEMDEGNLFAIECADSVTASRWTEVARRRQEDGTGRFGMELPRELTGRRFYRVQVLDATGVVR